MELNLGSVCFIDRSSVINWGNWPHLTVWPPSTGCNCRLVVGNWSIDDVTLNPPSSHPIQQNIIPDMEQPFTTIYMGDVWWRLPVEWTLSNRLLNGDRSFPLSFSLFFFFFFFFSCWAEGCPLYIVLRGSLDCVIIDTHSSDHLSSMRRVGYR